MPSHQMSAGQEWFYEAEGAGETLLFLHGWGVDSRIWQQQVSYFSRRNRVVVIDLPGHGRSSWQPMGLEAIARSALEVLDSVGAAGFHAVGSSLGGLVALLMHDLAAPRMLSLVFVGSHPKFVEGPDYPYGLKKTQTERLARQLQDDYPKVLEVFFRSLFTAEEREGTRYRWMRSFKASAAVPRREALARLLGELEGVDLRERLPKVVCPVAFFNGRHDYFFPAQLEHHWQARLPRARFVWFEGCGHFPFLTQPAQFNHELEKFWQGSEGERDRQGN